jgi:hypothetical protein
MIFLATTQRHGHRVLKALGGRLTATRGQMLLYTRPCTLSSYYAKRMDTFRHPAVAALGRRMVDAPHNLAVAFLVTPGRSVAIVVAERESGLVVAWDGFYNEVGPPFPDVASLSDLGWDEWDDMPSKLVQRAQGPWLGGFVGDWLVPTYSVAREAAKLVRSTDDLAPDQVQQLVNSVLVAYLPIVDRDVFDREAAVPTAKP